MSTNEARGRVSDALPLLKRMARNGRKAEVLFAQGQVNATIAELLSRARENAALTQHELAKLIGTKQPVIARLENAKYRGHSLTMLQRIAAALNLRLEIGFTPLPKRTDEEL
ncbi:MAG: multiprotein-bridging factor 1 family protein [Verrucomicrobiia bacterium]